MPAPTRLLVVEDDEAYRRLLVAAFEAMSDETNPVVVDAFADPGVALRWACDNRAALDCIVSDYRMPALTGGDLFVALREAGVDRPFVLVSGSRPSNIPEATRESVAAFVQKGGRGALSRVRTAVTAALSDGSEGDGHERGDGCENPEPASDIYPQTANPRA
jgi:DNA-binding NtrC family response regulator